MTTRAVRLLAPLLLLLLAPAANGQTAAWRYKVEGLPGGQAGTLAFTAQGNGWSGSADLGALGRASGALTNQPAGWSLPWPAASTPGLTGGLTGSGAATGQPGTLLFAGDPGSYVVELRLLQGGQVTRLRALREGPPPPPPGPEPRTRTPIQEQWWAALPVATWGVLRSVWDFVRYGRKHGGERLRGGVDQAESRALLQALGAEPRPWSAKRIYLAALAGGQRPKRALQRCLALVLDHADLPLRPLPGVVPSETLQDKYMHLFSSALIVLRSNRLASITVGFLKEVLDQLPGGSGFNRYDLAADVHGACFGDGLRRGIVRDP